MVEPALGLRVIRGPDWEWEDQDGGEGYVGTVVELEEGGDEVIVQWDIGQRCRYRCGREHKFDLRVLDCGPTGAKFCKYPCHVCRKEVCGVVWRCLHCPEYYLCSLCYLANYHCSFHRFTCLLDRHGKQYRVSPRFESRRITVRGLFPGAEVVRGVDWKWNDQDGGEGNLGKVEKLSGMETGPSGGSERSVVTVQWERGKKNKYRAGLRGKVDVRCIKPGNGGYYYPEHLPVLGQEVKQTMPDDDIVSGDRVKCEVDPALLEDAGMIEKIGLMLDHVGTVNNILSNGELMVRFPGNSLIKINPSIARKVDVPVFEAGDVVRMISDMAQAYQLQQGHGEWNDDMALCLDQVGKVIKAVGETTVTVKFSSHRWVLNPRCLRHAPNEDPPTETDFDGGISLLRGEGLSLLIDSIGPCILIHATSRGDISTVRAFLEKYPHQVNTLEQGKTAVHVAVAETRLNILELILKFNPDLSVMDDDGDTALHACAFFNALEATSMLLKAGADVNARNVKRGVTPIMIAGAVGNIELMELMATHSSADVDIQDEQGQTALHHVISSHRTRAIPILISVGANLDLLNSNLFNPLMEAVIHGSHPGVEDIVRKCPEMVHWKRPTDSITPLQLAGVRNHLFIVRHLALCGCDVNAKSDIQRNALHASIIEGHSAVVELLIGLGVDINVRDSEGNTALHIAFVNKNSQPLSDMTPQMNKVRDELDRLPIQGTVPIYLIVSCFLVQEGGDPSVRNNSGRTPAQICPRDKRDILLNYINKSNRGGFHGSLREDKAATMPNITSTENSSRPIKSCGSVTSSQTDTSSSFTNSQSVEKPARGGARPWDSGASQQSTSIMEARHQPVMGTGSQAGSSHREKDRLKLQLETGKKEGESKSPPSLSAEELRKRREAYFTQQSSKRKVQSLQSTTKTTSLTETSQTSHKKNPVSSRETDEVVHTPPPPTRVQKRLCATNEREDNLQSLPVKMTPKQYDRLSTVITEPREKDKKGEMKLKMSENTKQVQTENSKKDEKQNISHSERLKGSSSISHKDGANVTVLCFVCESPADASFTPCGHRVACRNCAERAKRCPICKDLVNGTFVS